MVDREMPDVIFSHHAVIQMQERGAEDHEVIAAIREGDREPARGNRVMYRKNFAFDKVWCKHRYGTVIASWRWSGQERRLKREL